MEYHEFRAMNTAVVLAAEGRDARVQAGFQHAQAFIEACERRFTRFSESSDLSALNRAAGTWQPVSTEMFDVLRQARRYWEATGGLFDPTILEALELAGYDRSLEAVRAGGAGAARAGRPPAAPGFGAVELDEETRRVRLPAGVRIDLGGIAKGWIAEGAAWLLSAYAPACAVDAGGDLFAAGLPQGEPAWQVGLEDPRDPQQTLAVLRVGPGAVATSSVAKRRWRQGDRVRHHLIDPRSGEPAETDWLSVTVIAPHATTAEAYAKALLIAGSRKAEALAARCREIVYLAVDRDGRLWGSRGAREVLDV